MDEREIIDLLHTTLQNPINLAEAIRRMQHEVFNREQAFSSAVDEILRELAYDLDYFQPDPRVRSEDASLLDEERALEKIRVALDRIAAAYQ
jgi:hypothetical protein